MFFFFATLSTLLLPYVPGIVLEKETTQVCPKTLNSKKPQLMILFSELAVLLLALNHDCQSCACSTNVHPKSSTNVFVPSQHQPPVPVT